MLDLLLFNPKRPWVSYPTPQVQSKTSHTVGDLGKHQFCKIWSRDPGGLVFLTDLVQWQHRHQITEWSRNVGL